MTIDPLIQSFEERLQEIEVYLDLLEHLEQQVAIGPPRIGGSAITTQQQKILYSSVYLQLYNLVEATITWCVDAVSAAATEMGRWKPSDLAELVRREWIRSTARTHLELTAERRLNNAVEVCDHLINALPLLRFTLERRSNIDDLVIQQIAERLGLEIKLSREALRSVKQPVRDDKGPLTLVKDLRNRLAHGSLSFSECGEGVTVLDLRELKMRTALYLREVIAGFRAYIDSYEYLAPARRP
jgi:MAE_28990/MAE_18760-like HEPN